MRIIEGLSALAQTDLHHLHGQSLESRSVVTVGVFDGVHLGHLRMLQELQEMASECSGLPTVITFRDHPDRLIKGAAPESLISLDYRLRLLRRAGVRRTLLLDFDERLRAMSATTFVEQILVRGLRTVGLLLGFDSALGKDREGTPEMLIGLGAHHGFTVREGQPLLVDGRRVSSTAIREAIRSGDLALSQRLLGRRPSAFGRVVGGDGRGHKLGFPTANVQTTHCVLPPGGVYAVEVIHDGSTYLGIANLGVRPTFHMDADIKILEVHLFDWQGDLYGVLLEVCFVCRLREERRFANSEELTQQIRDDIRDAREVFGR